MTVTPAAAGLLDRVLAHRRGELRRLDLLAHGIEVDLDEAGLVELGMAPDHDDILAQLQLPDQLLEPLWAEWHWSRPVTSDGLPAAIASRGQGPGQAMIDQARAEADRVREVLVELARVKVEDQVEVMAQRPTPDQDQGEGETLDQALDRIMAERDQLQVEIEHQHDTTLDQVPPLPPDPGPNPAPGNGQGSQASPETGLGQRSDIPDNQDTSRSHLGQGQRATRNRSRNRVGQTEGS